MQREQKYSRSLKIWLDEIRHAIKGLYTRNPNFKQQKDEYGLYKAPYYERNNYKNWEEYIKTWEELLLSRTNIFNLILEDVKSFEDELKIKDKMIELILKDTVKGYVSYELEAKQELEKLNNA